MCQKLVLGFRVVIACCFCCAEARQCHFVCMARPTVYTSRVNTSQSAVHAAEKFAKRQLLAAPLPPSCSRHHPVPTLVAFSHAEYRIEFRTSTSADSGELALLCLYDFLRLARLRFGHNGRYRCSQTRT